MGLSRAGSIPLIIHLRPPGEDFAPPGARIVQLKQPVGGGMSRLLIIHVLEAEGEIAGINSDAPHF
jgi:hypothetical protein